MSRAFTKELDGWNFCRSRKMECSDAAFNGRCELGECKFREDGPAAEIETKQERANRDLPGKPE